MDARDPLADLLLGRAHPVPPPVPVPPVPVPAVRSVPVVTTTSPAPRVPGGFAVLGMRSTGPSPVRDRLLQVAVVVLDPSGALVREWSTLLDPRRPGAGDRSGAPAVAGIAGELVALLSGRVLVAHPAASGVALLRAELARAGAAVPLTPVLCTLEATWRARPDLPRWRLSDCCAAAGVPCEDTPSALADARAAAGLVRALLDAPAERRDAVLARLVARAAATAWPGVPGPRALPVPLTQVPRRSAVPTGLAGLLDGVRLDDAGLPLPAAAGYAEVVAGVLAAHQVTAGVAQALADCAEDSVTWSQARATHRGILLAAARTAGTVTADDAGASVREELLAAAAGLGVPTAEVLAALGDVPGARPPAVVDLREPRSTTTPAALSGAEAR